MLVLKFARENRSWGYGRIAGALANPGHEVGFTTVANILRKLDDAGGAERDDERVRPP